MVCYEFFPEESIFGKMTVKIDFLDLLTAKNNFLTTGGLGQIPCTPYLPFSFFFCYLHFRPSLHFWNRTHKRIAKNENG